MSILLPDPRLPKPRPWMNQPRGSKELNRCHPLINYVKAIYLPSVFKGNLVNRVIEETGNVSIVNSPTGLALYGGSTSDNPGTNFLSDSTTTISTGFSIIAIGQCLGTTGGDGNSIITCGNMLVGPNWDNSTELTMASRVSSFKVFTQYRPFFFGGSPIGSWATPLAIKFDSSRGPAFNNSGSGNLYTAGTITKVANTYKSALSYIVIIDKTLTRDEWRIIGEDPYGLVLPKKSDRIWIPSTSLEYRSVTEQPKNGSAIDYDNSVGASLSMFAHASEGLEKDVLTGRVATVSDGSAFTKTDSWYKVIGATVYSMPTIDYGGYLSIAGLGVQFVKTGTCNQGNDNLFGGYTNSYSWPRLNFVNDVLRIAVYSINGVGNSWDIMTPTNGTIYTVAVYPDSSDIANEPTVYVNGTIATLSNKIGTNTGTPYSPSTGSTIRLFSNNGGSTMNCDVSCVAVFKTLDATKAASWTANPWQVLKEPFRPVGTARTTQPNKPTGIDWSNPITRNLRFAYTPGTDHESVSGRRNVDTNPMVFGNIEGMVGMGGNGSASYAKVAGRPSASNDRSSILLWYQGATGLYDNVRCSYGEPFINEQAITYMYNAGDIMASCYPLGDVTVGPAKQLNFASTVITPNVKVCSLNGGNDVTLGAGTAPTFGGPESYIAGATIRENYFTTAGNYIFLYAVWDRALSNEERASLYKNPWQIFARAEKESITPKEDRSKSVAQSRSVLWNTAQTKPTSAFIHTKVSARHNRQPLTPLLTPLAMRARAGTFTGRGVVERLHTPGKLYSYLATETAPFRDGAYLYGRGEGPASRTGRWELGPNMPGEGTIKAWCFAIKLLRNTLGSNWGGYLISWGDMAIGARNNITIDNTTFAVSVRQGVYDTPYSQSFTLTPGETATWSVRVIAGSGIYVFKNGVLQTPISTTEGAGFPSSYFYSNSTWRPWMGAIDDYGAIGGLFGSALWLEDLGQGLVQRLSTNEFYSLLFDKSSKFVPVGI